MSEAFGVASSAVGVISLGIQIAQGILWYYGAWQGQDDDVLRICASLGNLKGTLDVLLKAINPPAAFSKDVKENVEKSIDAFNRTLQKLRAELDKVKDTEPPKSGTRSKFRRHVRRALSIQRSHASQVPRRCFRRSCESQSGARCPKAVGLPGPKWY